MQINVIYDQSQGSLPSGFVAAVNYVVNYFDTTFTSPVNVDLGRRMTGDPNTQVSVGSSRRRFHKHRSSGQRLTQIDVAYDQSLGTPLVDRGVGIS
jgi:hypothetical protein